VLRRPVESTQYTSAEFARFCADNRIKPSVGRTGVCVAEYIEIFYNRKRLHSSLAYRTPADSPTTNPGPRPDQQTSEELSKIVNTAQLVTFLTGPRPVAQLARARHCPVRHETRP
jgi:hypothetical protein